MSPAYRFDGTAFELLGTDYEPPQGTEPTITTSFLSSMTEGEEFSQIIEYDGDPATSAALLGDAPGGLYVVVLDGVVALGGMPSESGSFTFSIRVINPAGFGDRSYTVSVLAAPVGSYWKSVSPVTHGQQVLTTNVGLRPGVTRTNYSGSTTITTDNLVLKDRNITGRLSIQALNVQFVNCQVTGRVYVSDIAPRDTYSFSMIDCLVNASPTEDTAIGSQGFTLIRTRITGSRRSAFMAYKGYLEECYIGGQTVSPDDHASAVRMSSFGTMIRCNISCDPPSSEWGAGGGVSATLTGYGDFETVQNNDIISNYWRPTDGGYSAYGGSTAANYPNAHDIRFIDNIFERRTPGGPNGFYGNITGFNPSAPGNVWENNRYTDGVLINP